VPSAHRLILRAIIPTNMRRRFNLTFLSLQIPLDLAALMLAALSAYAFRMSNAFVSVRPLFTQIDFSEYIGASFIFSSVFIAVFALSGLYSIRDHRAWNELGRIIVGCTAGTMILIATVFFQRDLTTSRFIVLAIWSLSILYVSIGRLGIRTLRHALLRAGFGHHRLAIIGRGKAATALADLYKQNPILGYTVIKKLQGWNDQTKEELLKQIDTRAIDEILLADPNIPKEQALELIAIAESNNITFRYLADLFAASFTNISVSTNGGIPVIEVKRTPLEGWGRIFKRLFDITISLFVIILTSPIMLVIAIAIKCSSKGPIFYAKKTDGTPVRRIGEEGSPFTYFKFRTMKIGADKLHLDPAFIKQYGNLRAGPLMKLKTDPRVTSIGVFLRKWSLDELPEFFLVLKGDMSLVGPRPHLPEEVRLYKPHHRRVLGIKPGITGMAQISGRADLDFEDEVKIDTWYIEHWSPALDLWIMLKTPFVVLSRKGAY
jgi:exopolysaccharide biosynthesis polyprenyl glycosylphosphotransferase